MELRLMLRGTPCKKYGILPSSMCRQQEIAQETVNFL